MTAPNSSGSSLFFRTDGSKTEDIGILVLTAPLVIVYMNAPAQAIISRIYELEPEREHRRSLPSEILRVCVEMMDLFRESHHRTILRPFEHRREIDTPSHRLLLRCIAFPQPESDRRSYLCILMEALQSGVDHSDGPFLRSTCHV